MEKKSPKYNVPTAEELVGTAKSTIEQKAITYDIDEWQISVELVPTSFSKYLNVIKDIRLQYEKNNQGAELQSYLFWIFACLKSPVLSYDQLQSLADADVKPVRDLAYKCQVISGHLPEEFDPEVEEAKNDSEAVEDTTESTPPVLSDSESLPVEPDSPTESLPS